RLQRPPSAFRQAHRELVYRRFQFQKRAQHFIGAIAPLPGVPAYFSASAFFENLIIRKRLSASNRPAMRTTFGVSTDRASLDEGVIFFFVIWLEPSIDDFRFCSRPCRFRPPYPFHSLL